MIPRMGASGSALASAIGEMVSLVVLATGLWRYSER